MASANHLPSVLYTKTVSVALNVLNDVSSGGNAYIVLRAQKCFYLCILLNINRQLPRQPNSW